MTQPILVTGGTGTLGRRLVPRLTQAGCAVRVLTRRRLAGGDGIEYLTGDLATGEGIEAAVRGTGAIVHCAGGAKGDGGATAGEAAGGTGSGRVAVSSRWMPTRSRPGSSS